MELKVCLLATFHVFKELLKLSRIAVTFLSEKIDKLKSTNAFLEFCKVFLLRAPKKE